MRHRIIALCGPSGSGKTTLQNALLSAPNSDFVRVVGDTTRPPREGEIDGVDYHFVSEELFAQRVADGEYLEHATVYGHRKGVRRAEFNRVTTNHPHKAILIVLDRQGIENYSTSFEPGEFTAVFLVGPDKPGLERRMLERGDKPEDIATKLADRDSELNWAVSEPYVDFFLPDTSVTHGVALVTCLAAVIPLARNDFLGRVTDDLRVKSGRG